MTSIFPKCGDGILRKLEGKYAQFFGFNRFPACQYTQGVKLKSSPRVETLGC